MNDNKVLRFAADKTPYLLDVSTDKPIRAFKGHKNTVYCGKVANDKTKFLTGSEDTTVRLWDLTDDQKTPAVFSHHAATVGSVCFAEEDKSFVSADVTGKIMLVDFETGTVKRTFDGHGDMIVLLKLSAGSLG